MRHAADPRHSLYDAVIVGGAVAGAATALLLRRRHPELQVLVVKKIWRVRVPHRAGSLERIGFRFMPGGLEHVEGSPMLHSIFFV